MKLYEPFPDRITVDGQEYRLTLWFDRVLRFYDVLDDPDLTPEEKTEAGFSWLVDCRKPRRRRYRAGYSNSLWTR